MMKRKLTMLLVLCLAFSMMAVPAYAAEYTIDAPEAGLFAEPTSQHTVYVGTTDTTNIDRSKNAAYIPPAFGSPTSYLPGSGELLTPNLVAGQTAATVQTVTTTVQTSTGSQSITIPSVVQTGTQTYTPTGYTAVTDSLYYADDSLGTISIPEIGLTVKVYQGTSDAALKKGAGHFSSTSIWNGNAAFTLDEVRRLDKAYALLFISGELPVIDRKFDLMKHPYVKLTEYGGAAPYVHKEERRSVAASDDLTFTFTSLDTVEIIEMEEIKNEEKDQQNQQTPDAS